MPPRKNLRHLFISERLERFEHEVYRPITGFPNRPQLTARQKRYLHANKLNGEIDTAISSRHTILIETSSIPDSVPSGICLDIEGSDQNPLAIEAMEDRSVRTAPVELLNVRWVKGKIHATIFVPERQIEKFKNKINKYGDESRDPQGTKRLTINIDSIEAIQLAKLDAFWMEDVPLPTDTQQIFTWEVWLRRGKGDLLRTHTQQFGFKVSEHSLRFHECEICLLTISLDTLSILQVVYAPLIGFRYREVASGFFTDLPPVEQAEWVQDLAVRLQLPDQNAPAVCLLDTGVHQLHPLLNGSLAETDCDSYDPTWKKEDHYGHGTQMAGIALLGDLSLRLTENTPVEIKHRLESVKILPPHGENPEELYGWITQECIARAQINAPNRKRVFCLAVTNPGNNTNGRPTAWSATLDKLSMGIDSELNINDDNKQLFLVSVGNIRDLSPNEYQSRNDLEPVENPSQSWNSLSVGAITMKAFSDDTSLDGWRLVSPPGDIAPSSRTSVSWAEKEWPIKPDIVFEGGNYVTDDTLISNHPDLSVLTTGHNVPFTVAGGTSAATAEAARMAAILQAEYPDCWPETIRGLIVHSAFWNEAMKRGIDIMSMRSNDKENLLRRFGYGIPRISRARFSASHRPCLISQHSLQPFSRSNNSENTYLDINYHKMPWPTNLLKEFGATKMWLRVTLSYFIEPNPSKRPSIKKYSYASHRLKFALQRPLETFQKFKERVNKNARSIVEEHEPSTGIDNWVLGVNARNKGSVISDIWCGNGADFAEQNTIAIMPEAGWWKYRKYLERTNSRARYSLIVTLESEAQEFDIYTPISNLLNVPTLIQI